MRSFSQASWALAESVETLTAICKAWSKDDTPVVGRAKDLWRRDKDAAFKMLLEASETTVPLLQELTEKIKTASSHEGTLVQRVADLEKEVRRIGALLAEADAKHEEMRRVILLGQLAYKLSRIIEQYVYGPEGSGELVPLKMKDLVERSSRWSGHQRTRWDKVVREIQRIMPLSDAVKVDKYLRWLRFEVAHGTGAEESSASLADLLAWAQQGCDAKAVSQVQKFTRVLNRFSNDDKPLLASVTGIRNVVEV